jgi:tetratricopeptide (TPR) repeat protein
MVLAIWLGRFEQAAGHHQLAVHLYRETGDRTGEAIALGNLGTNELRLGRLQESADHLGQALALSRETGDRVREAGSRDSLGELHLRQGQYQQASGRLHKVWPCPRPLASAPRRSRR